MRRLALLLLLLTACHPLDRRAPFARPDYVSQHDRVSQAGYKALTCEGQFLAGWARTAIDAPDEVPLAGYSDRQGAPSEGTADPSYVRAFAMGTEDLKSVVFTADLLLSTPEITRAVRAGLVNDVAPEAVFFTASHTHSGPGGYKEGLLWQIAMGPFNEAALQAIVQAHLTAARAALKDMAPASIGHARRRVPGLIHNRVEKDGPVDDEVFVVRLQKLESKAAAAFWSYGCHAVTLPPENLRISADYPGSVAGHFEDQDLQVLGFAAGGVGSANPKIEKPHDNRWIVNPLVRGLKKALAEAKREQQINVKVSRARVEVQRPDLNYRVDDELGLSHVPISMLIDMPTAEYGALAINDLVLSFMPAEVSGTLVRDAKLRARRSGVDLAMFPFNGTYLGYIVPQRVYNLPEAQHSDMHYYETHVSAFLGPWGGDYLMNLGLRLAGLVHGKIHIPHDPRFDWMLSKAAVNNSTSPRPDNPQ